MNLWKNTAGLLLCCMLLLTGLSNATAATVEPEIKLYLDGVLLKTDVPPFIVAKANVTMVPIRVISEGLGADITWSPATRTATITQGAAIIQMTSGQGYASVNGSNVPLDATVQNKSGRVMVPLRFVGENLGLTVGWNQTTHSVTLQSSDNGEVTPPVTTQPSGLRGAWISTVFNLDWPSTASQGKEAVQKQEYIKLLDQLQGMGMNAAFVQVRPASDALYPSDLVPWSKVLTGVQGRDPGYDPLAFLIEETHKRGMEFHAWFNPFRANTDTKTTSLAANHVAIQHPEWIVASGTTSYINPGIPEARQHIIDTIMEVVNHYNIDGVHLDDYFYPSSGVFSDDATFALYNPTSILLKADWRRDNINTFVQTLSNSIHLAKPAVQFGISPFGVWRNKAVDPTGSDTKAGVTAYDSMYADVRTWIKQGWIDYVAPQIYWSLSFSTARYDKLVDWWSNEVSGTNVKLYIGHSPYKLGTTEAGWQSSDEIINQLKYNALRPQVQGDLFFSAKDLIRNPLGVVQALQAYYQIGGK